jgi:NADPH-dependent 2,4-dienoyl-CoA reductase/sulfur reductase-like enzyme
MGGQRDVIVIGAGPAGLSAATRAADLGLDVLVLDEQPAPGGQLYRNIERANAATLQILGPDYSTGLDLVEKFRKSAAQYQAGSIVWNVEPNGTVYFSQGGRSSQVRGKFVIIAIGAMERAVPFSGWNLPGVMGVGGIDANFKSSGTVPDSPVVIGGSGPLLLLIIGHLTSLGVEISAVLDTTPLGNMVPALPLLPGALRRIDYLLKGVGMLLNVKRTGIPYHKSVTAYSAHGNSRLESVSFTAKGNSRRVESRLFLTHEGIVPRCDFTRLLGLPHSWDPVQRYWYPQTNRFGATENDVIYIAGDGAFIHGGIPAIIKGALAALDIAEKLNLLPASDKADTIPRLEKELFAERAPRPFVDALYKPHQGLYNISNETVVCRCEEVTAGDIRQAVEEGCREPNEIKALTRCGMGHCQGRMCGGALAEIIAGEFNLEPEQLRPLNIRAPVRNLSLSELSEVVLLENSDQ